MIALVLDVDNRTWGDFTSILLIHANTGEELRRLTHDLPVRGRDYVWSPKGDEVYARVGHGGLEQIYAIPIRGEPRQLTHGLRTHWNMSLSPDGRRLGYQTTDGYGRKDIRVLDLNTAEERIVLVLDEPANEFTLGEWRHVRWGSTNGVQPFGHLILPPHFDPNQQYAMIVDVHGGGEGSPLGFAGPITSGVAFGPLEWHAWAALGYIVFVPDYRSSGDYGPEVIAARYKSGKFGAIKDIDDIMSGTHFVISQGFVDPSRIAILGNSAGGQRVYILLTRNDLYAAAILNESISPDPVSIFIKLASGENTGGYPAGIFRQMYGGNLADFPDRYKTNYMFDSHRIKTPTLILLGNEELGGIYHMPNEVLYSILKQHNVPTRLIKFVEEGHAYSRPESAKLAFNEVRQWLEKHMPADLVDSRAAAVN
jgi:dipeptidyl aminopeptidase/acylaminoacyl peptidase